MIYKYKLDKNWRTLLFAASIIFFVIAFISGYQHLTYIPIKTESLQPKEFTLSKIECYGREIKQTPCTDRLMIIYDTESNRYFYPLAPGYEKEEITNKLKPGDNVKTYVLQVKDKKGRPSYDIFGFVLNNNKMVTVEKSLKDYNENYTVAAKWASILFIMLGSISALMVYKGVNIIIIPFARFQPGEVERVKETGGRKYLGAGFILIIGYVIAWAVARFVLDPMNITSALIRLTNYIFFFTLFGIISGIYLKK